MRRIKSVDDHSQISSNSRSKSKPRQRSNYNNSQSKKKWTCVDDNGYNLTAGGILPYDDNGIWVISEKQSSGSRELWNDVGGKWRFEDIDIFGCITREWNEELYFTAELRRSDLLKDLIHRPRTSRVYVNDHERNPTYLAYIIHVDDLESIDGVKMNKTEFDMARKHAISSNPSVPSDYYSSISLQYITYEQLRDELFSTTSISYRLRKILLHGSLKNNLSQMTKAVPESVTTFTPKILKRESRDENLPASTTPKLPSPRGTPLKRSLENLKIIPLTSSD